MSLTPACNWRFDHEVWHISIEYSHKEKIHVSGLYGHPGHGSEGEEVDQGGHDDTASSRASGIDAGQENDVETQKGKW